MSYDYDLTHNNIIKSAKKQFMEKGFRGASIRSICREAGVTNGAFYAHFISKEELFNHIVMPAMEGLENMYDAEEEQYMDIRSLEDIIDVFKNSYTSVQKIIAYICEYREEFMFILKAGDGTPYENLVDSFIEKESNGTIEFLKLCKTYVKGVEKISENVVNMTSSFVVKTIFNCLCDGMTKEEIMVEAKNVGDFCIEGYKGILGLNQSGD